MSKANELFDKAWKEMKNGNYDQAIKDFVMADQYGHAEALCCAGICCQFKIHDIYGAIKFYEEAIAKKCGNACYFLSVCYRKGDGVEKNEEEAERLYQLSKEYNAPITNEGFNEFLSRIL